MARTTRRLCRWAGGTSGLAILLATGLAGAQPAVPEPPPPIDPWYDLVQLRAFADGYYSQNLAFPKPSSYQPPTRYFDGQQGFGLAWMGLDAAFAPEPVGGTVNLRFGPMATLHAGGDADSGLEYVKQAFASWKPGGADGMLRVDLGKFDTFAGAEIAETQDNFNYTRGLLYVFAQPRFHTGLRATAELVPELTLTAMAANGWDRSVDNNVGKTFGVAATVNPSDAFAASIGWIGGPEQDDAVSVDCAAGSAYSPSAGGCAPSAGAPAQTWVVDRGGANSFDAWRHLIDFVLAVQPTETLSLALNADYGFEGVRPADTGVDADPTTKKWYGAALLGRMQLSDVWAAAVRGEYFEDPDGHTTQFVMADGTPLSDVTLASGTLTLEARPSENLILRWENRGDFVLDADPAEEIFRGKVRDSSSRLFTSTLGVVVTTN